jgi:Enoyl-CoA hydratase/isomerase
LKRRDWTGAGRAFCAGADLKVLAEGERKPVDPTGDFAPMGPTRLRLSKPVVAAIEGPAIARGMELALWCDLRIVGTSAVFGIFSYANKKVLAALRTRLNLQPDGDLTSISVAAIHDAAVAELKSDTQRRQSVAVTEKSQVH